MAAVVPAAAYAHTRLRANRLRSILRLEPPARRHESTLAAIVSAVLLVGLAATGPVWRSEVGASVRTDAEAVFIFDTSRSMAAASKPGAPTRMAQAQAAAIEFRNTVLSEVRSGVASLTTQLLPHLFPSPDLGTFGSIVRNAIGIERPPPPALELGLTGTSFRPLMQLRNTGFFDPSIPDRFAILITDGESAQLDPVALGQSLADSSLPPQVAPGTGGQGGGQAGGFPSGRGSEAPVRLFILRLGGAGDRIYDQRGEIETAYRPDPRAAEIVDDLAKAAHGHAYTSVSAAETGLRSAVASGARATQGSRLRTTNLAPYAALLALLPLALVVLRRNLTRL